MIPQPGRISQQGEIGNWDRRMADSRHWNSDRNTNCFLTGLIHQIFAVGRSSVTHKRYKLNDAL